MQKYFSRYFTVFNIPVHSGNILTGMGTYTVKTVAEFNRPGL